MVRKKAAARRKPDPLPPVIKVKDLQRSYPQQLAEALDPAPEDFAKSLLRHLKRIELRLKRIEHRLGLG